MNMPEIREIAKWSHADRDYRISYFFSFEFDKDILFRFM